MTTHKLTQKSLELFSENEYLDILHGIYSIGENLPRVMEEEDEKRMKTLFESGSDEEFFRFLITLPKFPINDSYVAAFSKAGKEKLEMVIKNNSKTIARICKRVRVLGFEKARDKCLVPIEPSRQMGSKFSTWLMKEYPHTKDSNEFLNSREKCIVFDGGDKAMTLFALKYIYDKLPRGEGEEAKGIDLLIRLLINNKPIYVLGEAKFLTDFGGTQNNQFNDAITFLTSSNFKLKRNVEVRRCAIIDGVCWMNWKSTKMQKKISELNNQQPAFSALFLKDFLNSIK
jgi:hypothetical protein